MRHIHKLILLGIALFVGVQGATAKELRLATAPPAKSPWGLFVTDIANRVKEASGGKLIIKGFFNAQLGGSEANQLRQVVRGRIDLGANSNSGISSIVPEFALISAPYIWKNLAQADCVADKHLLPVYNELMNKRGLVLLTWMEIGYQVVFADNILNSPSDLKGIKIRTAPTKTDTLYMLSTGASAIPLGTAESMAALKTGIVSMATFPMLFGVSVGYVKIKPAITVTNHSYQLGGVVISKKVWDGMSAEERSWLGKSGAAAGSLRNKLRNIEKNVYAKLKKSGNPVHYPTPAELTQWKSTAPDVVKKLVQELGGQSEEIWKVIQKARKACAT
jgi:TRAP-type C4-dicarboxylate transport system substrate-binding protein